ncbi:MAG: hypothetical protein RLZ51_381 [Pseudomonadota bacterium]|jgi:uncharacterized protein YutE (UPF0331/DUF86 family)
MVDADLLLKKAAFIRSCLRELRELGQLEQIRSDLREERFVVHTLQLACQAALDLASHVVSDQALGEPQTNRELFALLQQAGLIDADLAASMARLAGFRNVIVHGYERVSLDVVEDVVRHRLGDLETFADQMARLARA